MLVEKSHTRTTLGEWTSKPDRREVAVSLSWAAVLTILFFSVYGYCNWAAAASAARWRLWFDWERDIPFIAWMVWPYFSLFASFFLPMFALRRQALDILCRRLALTVAVSGAIFLMFPAELAFVRPVDPPNPGFALIYAWDLPHNLAPSLHISWAATILWSLRMVSPPLIRRLLETWFVVLCAAVLLTHQHHVIDVAGGILVACFSWRVIRRENWPFIRGASA
jgi:hypothetical protein